MSELANQKVVVVGQGYVGLPVAMRAVEVGFNVVGFDLDQRKIDGLSSGKTHIDDITDSDVAAALASGRYKPSNEPRAIAGFDIAVITVPTPLRDGAPDLSYIESSGELLARFLRPGATVILESTTFPGTTEEILQPILEEGSGLTAGADFHLGFSPERIDPGNLTWDFQRTPKVVAGVDEASLKLVQEFYDAIVDTTVPVSGTREAELTKLLENTFRHVNIALVNELAVHSKALGIDLWEVIAAASSKPFGFMPFYPGPGVGGHCLPIDPSYLSYKIERQLGTVSRFVKIANDVNEHMPDYVVKRVQLGLNERSKPVKGSRVLVLGIAYKKNSNDARETPATPVIEQFLALGAEVHVHDRHVDGFYELDRSIRRVDLTDEEIEAADVVVLITDHDDVDYDGLVEKADYIFDSRHLLSGDNVELL
ncbi:MAG: UDP-N-acetyl-D-glucosamine dehydrogenase [Acidimicrobiales bacterium]|jgi:UDP-N-acetyl-D-glucosamine dehydrogenase